MDDYGDMDGGLGELLPTNPQQKMQALAQALAGKTQQAPASLLFAMGANPVAAPFAHQAQQEEEHALQRAMMAQRYAGLDNFHQGELDARGRANDLRQESIERHKIARAGNGETLDYDPMSGEASTLRAAPPPRPLARSIGSKGGKGAAVTPLPDEIITQLADQWNKDGRPPTARALAPHIPAIAARMAERHPGADLATNAAAYYANRGSLAEGTKLGDATDVNEGKALGDIEILEKTMAPLVETGSPFLNKHLREVEAQSGDPRIAAFRTARVAAVAGINKVLNAGTLTESARKEADELVHGDATLAQLQAGLQVLKQDMARSKGAVHKRISDTRARLSGQEPSEGAAPELDHSAAAQWLRNPKNKSNPDYQRALQAYVKANGREP